MDAKKISSALLNVEFKTIAQLFDAIRSYKLDKKARIIAFGSYNGAMIGFAEADTKEPGRKWLISRKNVKEAIKSSQKDDDELELLRKMLSYQGRRELIPWLKGDNK